MTFSGGSTHGYNNPVKYQDPTGHRPTDGCEYEGCELDDYLDPNETWITAQGQVSLIDPVLAAQYPGDFTWEEALFTATGLFGISAFPAAAEYGAARVALPALTKVISTLTSWFCLDGNCFNEAEVIYDHTLPAGHGETIIVQNITRIRLSPFGSALDRLQTLYHEQAHVFLTPRGPLQGLRTNISLWGYNNSHLLRYTEEQ